MQDCTPGYLTMKVWLSHTHEGHNHPLLTLESPLGMQFLLEAIASGSSLFDGQSFDITAYSDEEEIGRGSYVIKSHATSKGGMGREAELQVCSENGAMQGIVQQAWQMIITGQEQANQLQAS